MDKDLTQKILERAKFMTKTIKFRSFLTQPENRFYQDINKLAKYVFCYY